MTWEDLKKRAEALGAVGSAIRPWLPYIAAGIVVTVVGIRCNVVSRELATAQRQVAEARYEAAGLIAERDATISDLRGDLKKAGDEVASWRRAWGEALKKAPELRPVEVVRWRTADAPPASGAPPTTLGRECLYARGDMARLTGVNAKAEGAAGARVVVIGAQFERTQPNGPAIVWEGSATAPLSEAAALPPDSALGHGFGAIAVAVPGYLGVGPSWSPPPVKWWILRSGEASIGVPVSSGDKPGVVVSVHARF